MGSVDVIPMQSNSQVPQALRMFAKEIGASDAITCDASGEQTSKEVRDFVRKLTRNFLSLSAKRPGRRIVLRFTLAS